MISLNASTPLLRTAATSSSVTAARDDAIMAAWMSSRSPVTAATLSASESDCSERSSSIAPVTLFAKAEPSVVFAPVTGSGETEGRGDGLDSGDRAHALRPICRADS